MGERERERFVFKGDVCCKGWQAHKSNLVMALTLFLFKSY